MPKLADRSTCCGCAACYSICNRNAIFMREDKTGFLFPEIDERKCIECKLCEKACPALENLRRKSQQYSPRAFVGQHKNDAIRKESTSGGIFTAIAETIIDLNGIVFGAAMTNDFKVIHKYVQNKNELKAFRNSKYVQSEIGECYRICRQFLDEGRWVCFSGTPCQIQGLQKYLHQNYDKLITVDLVCHSVPSPLIFQKYISYQREKYSNFDEIVFRDKGWGYSYSTMALYKNKKCIYRNGSESDLWFRSFLPGLCDRESCYKCSYQEWPRISDITIWDCFTIGKINKEFDDNKGTTSIMVWSIKGEAIIEQLKKNIKIYEVPPKLFEHKVNREHEKKLNINREQLYIDAKEMPPDQFFMKYRPITTGVKIKKLIKKFLYTTRLYNLVKEVFLKSR